MEDLKPKLSLKIELRPGDVVHANGLVEHTICSEEEARQIVAALGAVKYQKSLQ